MTRAALLGLGAGVAVTAAPLIRAVLDLTPDQRTWLTQRGER